MSDRRIWSIAGNTQRLDGGAMFGNAPKPLWQRWITPDERNRIPLACRAMLIREERADRWILLETGIGAFFDPLSRDRYGVQEEQHVLLDSLQIAGVSHEDIDVVVLSHLHFDHAGGLLDVYREGEPHRLLFPGARFVVGGGVEWLLGPGALFGAVKVGFSDLDQRLTGDANTGAAVVDLGYRFLL